MSRRTHSENFKPLCVVAGNICSIAARQEVLRVPPFISLFPLAHQVPKRIYERISIPLEGIREKRKNNLNFFSYFWFVFSISFVVSF